VSSAGSITEKIRQLKAGDAAAAQKLWERYFRRLVGLAKKKLRNTSRRVEDEEDVVVSAFDSFINRARAGRFPKLRDRYNLWPLLVKITERKAIDLVRRNISGAVVKGESALLGAGHDSEGRPGGRQVRSSEPTPEFAAQLVEDFRRLLECLDDAELRSIALWKFEGYTNAEVAARTGCALATVERRLRLIRKIWERELA
jgi:RNA polymerase sigma factor (sigma-70 family)